MVSMMTFLAMLGEWLAGIYGGNPRIRLLRATLQIRPFGEERAR